MTYAQKSRPAFRVALMALVYGLLVTLLAVAKPAYAIDPPPPPPPKDWSDGPVTGDDFQGTPPPVEDREKTKGGIPIKGEIATGIDVDPKYSGKLKVVDGKLIAESTVTSVEVNAFMDKSKSWIDDDVKDDKEILDHEQGHMDTTEQKARELQDKLNKKKESGELTISKEIPKDSTQQQINDELDRQIAELDKKVDDAFNDANKEKETENKKYDDDTDHGTNKPKQKTARDVQKKNLAAPSTDPAKKLGANAQSRTDQSIKFDAMTKMLTIDQDIIVDVDPNGSGFDVEGDDAVLGAEVVIPEFELVGEQDDGLFFFSAVDPEAQLEIRDDGELLFGTTLPYLQYDPSKNMFYGIGGGFEAPGDSDFIRHMVGQLVGNEDVLALAGLELMPDLDFATLTNGFTEDGTSAASNGLGARDVSPVPIPAALPLFLSGLLGLGVMARRRRKQLVS